MPTDHHTSSGHYSGTNPVPKISDFLKFTNDKANATGTQADSGPKDHVDESAKDTKSSTRRIVTDPTTGRQVEIEDVSKDFEKAVNDPHLNVPKANLPGEQAEATVKTEAHQSEKEYAEKQDVTAPPDPVAPSSTSDVPIHGEKTNILFHPTPTVSYEPMFESLEKRASVVSGSVLAAIIFLGSAFGASLWGLIPTGIGVAIGIWLWMKEVVRSGRASEWHSEKKRGEIATQNLIPESVEWMNTFMGILWGLINPDAFAAVADQIEDVMQASLPGFIENIRVSDISQGSNPIRILSLRALPDDQVEDLKSSIHEDFVNQNKDPQEMAALEEGGDFYNIECAFAYHAAPVGRGVSSKARNAHLKIDFYLGIKGLFGVPLPIWAELQGLVGTVRLRLAMSPVPPFLKALTFTLMGVPKLEIGCVPMMEKGINILNLPVISNFVNAAVATAMGEYVAPKSMTLDMSKMLAGDDVQKETEALGVIWVRIHRAVGLSKQDKRGSKNGGSDPYITLSFSKFRKPMYSTRVITDDLNPIFEETAAILVNTDHVKADEQLSVELWDSDRMSADDIVGKVELSLQNLIQHPGEIFPQVSTLQGMDAGSAMPGKLHWEVGFFGKPKFRPELRSHGKDVNLPINLRDQPEFQDDKGSLDNETEDAVSHTPPDPLWPSGIVSVVVHQIVNLELENITGTYGSRKGREYEPGQETGEIKEEEGGKLPSSYCTIIINDQLVYHTRTKVVTSQPIFNAGTERFVRDWRSAIVTVTVRDQRMREHDPILGVVPLKLSHVLQSSSQVTRWYPLSGGVGFGRIRLSLLFRSVETKLPPSLLGWDVGTFEFLGDGITAHSYRGKAKLKLRTGGSSGTIPRSQARVLASGDQIQWDLSGKASVRLPVKHRYMSPVVFELHTAGKRGADAYAMLWLSTIVDNEVTNIDLPIWKTKNGSRLTQNFLAHDTESARKEPGLEDLQEVGRLAFKCMFKPGTDKDHAKFATDNETRETQETWEACKADGQRGDTVTKEMPPEVQRLHDESLGKQRDILKYASEEERKKLIDKYGYDWSGAFGDDPAKYLDELGRKRREPGREARGDCENGGSDSEEGNDSSDSLDADEESTDNQENGGGRDGTSHGSGPLASFKKYRENQKGLHRRQRGLMQWKAARSAAFAKDELKFAARKMRNRIELKGREPDVETEV